MADRKQPTPIDAGEYDRFVQFVEDVHGGTRGHLRTELENALREYRESYYSSSDRLQRIEEDLSTVKAMVAEAESDGGATLPSADAEPHTHTGQPEAADSRPDESQGQADPVDVPDEEPHHRASSRRDRAAWLYGWVRDDIGPSGSIHRNAIATRASNIWGYDRDSEVAAGLADRCLDMMDDAWDIEDHPTTDGMKVWGDHADDVWEEHLDDQADDASGRMDDLNEGHPSSDD